MEVENKEFERLGGVFLWNLHNDQDTSGIYLQTDVVVLIFTFQIKTKSRSGFNLLFPSQYLLTEDYMRQREVWAAVNIQRWVKLNRPFAGSGPMGRNKLRWDANNAVGLSKQRKVVLDWQEFFCFGSPTALFASQRNSFRTIWPDPPKGLFLFVKLYPT